MAECRRFDCEGVLEKNATGRPACLSEAAMSQSDGIVFVQVLTAYPHVVNVGERAS